MTLVRNLERCPLCKEPIIPGAVRCKHCHADLRKDTAKSVGRFQRIDNFRAGFIAGTVFTAVLVILIYIQFFLGD